MRKILKRYMHLLSGWDRHDENTESLESISFKKDDLTIVFEEDKREHIINFTILHPCKRILKVRFRECIYADKNLNAQNLLYELQKLGNLPNEEEELKIYFQFMTFNNIL